MDNTYLPGERIHEVCLRGHNLFLQLRQRLGEGELGLALRTCLVRPCGVMQGETDKSFKWKGGSREHGRMLHNHTGVDDSAAQQTHRQQTNSQRT